MIKLIEESLSLVASVRGKHQSREDRENMSVELGELLLLEAKKEESSIEKKHELLTYKILNNLQSKAFVINVGDQVFRSSSDRRNADTLSNIISHFGIPRSLSLKLKFKLWLVKTFGESFPSLIIPFAKKNLFNNLSQHVVPAEKEIIEAKLEEIKANGFTPILHRIGEASVGEDLAKKRVLSYLQDLENPQIDRISLDLPAIVHLKNGLNRKEEGEKAASGLRLIFRKAMNPKGFKLVSLLSSQYEWLYFTVEVFKKVMGEEEFLPLSVALCLQSYFPDSFAIQKELTEWAKERVKRGGVPIKIIITKGALLGCEQIEASKRVLPQAPFTSKIETDANFKRMLEFGLKKERADAVQIEIATHNLFDLSYGILLSAENEIEGVTEISLFEKRVPYLQNVLKKIVKNRINLLFAIVPPDNLSSAMAYIMRRWDEYSGQDNFLKHIYELNFDSKQLDELKQIFYQSLREIDKLPSTPRRLDLLKEKRLSLFENEPPFDFSLKENRERAEKIVEKWKTKDLPSARFIVEDDLLEKAEKGQKLLEETSVDLRGELLLKAAEKFRQHKEDLIGSIMLETQKTFISADMEVGRAIDGFEYYYHRLLRLQNFTDIKWHAKGVFLSVCSSRMPCSSPSNMAAGAIAMGNSLIVVPSKSGPATGQMVLELLWEAGFPKDALLFMPISQERLEKLILDKRVKAAIHCGYRKDAIKLKELNPLLDLSAYSEGKNSFIISSMSDREQAAKDLVSSAFLSSSTQKVSAINLAILEKEVYDDPSFMQMVKDVASSLRVGSNFDLSTDVGPIGRSIDENFLKALQLSEKEEWLLSPRKEGEFLWGPIIKMGIQPGSFFHQESIGGPVLGLMRAQNISHAIELANNTPYGLLAAIHSLDQREHTLFMDKIEAGNIFINTNTNNIMIHRQPIGGVKFSSFGEIFQIGGPNFLKLFTRAEQVSLPKNKMPINDMVNHLTHFVGKLDLSAEELGFWYASVANYSYWWKKLKLEKDSSKVVGQDNFLRYVPKKLTTLRINLGSSILDVLLVTAATFTTNTPLEISWERLVDYPWIELLPISSLVEESEKELIERIRSGEVKELRLLSQANENIKKASSCCRIIDYPVLANGRFELLNYLKEVSITIDYHRYGNLGIREGELRKMPL